MRILTVHNFYQQPGGEDEVYFAEQAMLHDAGVEVGTLTFDNDAIAGMGKLTLARRTIWNSDAGRRVEHAARQFRAEVVHFHNTFPLVSPAGYAGAHRAGAAVVQTLHNFRLLCPSATLFHDGKLYETNLGKRVPFDAVRHRVYRGSLAATGMLAAMLAVHRTLGTYTRHVDRFITLHDFWRDLFIRGGLPGERIDVKPNFLPRDPGLGKGGGGYALFVARLTTEKGVSVLCDAWRDQTAELRIVGDGPLTQQVQALAEANPNVKYLGRLPRDEVLQQMRNASCAVVPSLWYEGPLTVIEAFACGTPVAGFAIGPMPGMVEHGRTGLLAETGNAAALRDAILELMSKHQSMRVACRAAYESRYTPAVNAPLLLESYRKAMAHRGIAADNSLLAATVDV